MVGLLRAQTWHGVVWLGGTTATEGGGGAPARRCAGLELTELEQRALEDAVGCWGGGGAVAVVLEWPGASCARLWRRRSGGRSAVAAARKNGRGEAKWSAGRLGRTLATLRRARAQRGLRGQGNGDARPSPGTRGARTLPVSATDVAIQFVQ